MTPLGRLVGFLAIVGWSAAIAGAQTVLVDDYANGNVYTVTPGSSSVLIGSGFTHPQQMTLGFGGNVYMADDGNNAIYTYSTSGAGVTNLANPSGDQFTGLTFDASANKLFVGDYTNSSVYSVSGGDSVATVNSGGLVGILALANNGAGTLYATAGGQVYSISESDGTPTSLYSLGGAYGIAYFAGDLYVANNAGGAGDVVEIDTAGSLIKTWSVNGGGSTGIDVDSNGNIFVESNAGLVSEIASGASTGTTFASISGVGYANQLLVVSPIPEPATYAALLGAAALGIAICTRVGQRAKTA